MIEELDKASSVHTEVNRLGFLIQGQGITLFSRLVAATLPVLGPRVAYLGGEERIFLYPGDVNLYTT
jgi:hypothetical protein